MLIHWLEFLGKDTANASMAELRAASICGEEVSNVNVAVATCQKAEEPGAKIYKSERATKLQAISSFDKHADMIWSSPVGKKVVEYNPLPVDQTYGITEILRPTSAPPVLRSDGNIFSTEDTCKFDEEEIPMQQDADTFIVTRQQYPEDRNGTLGNEIVEAVRSPLIGASRAGHACKLEAGRIIRSLKDKIEDTTETVVDGFSAGVKNATEGLDVPEMASRLTDPVFGIGDHWRSLEKTCKRTYRRVDNSSIGDYFERKRRRSESDEDFGYMDNMRDAYRLFAHRMVVSSRRALVTQKICRDDEVGYYRNNVPWLTVLEHVLGQFYLNHKQQVSSTNGSIVMSAQQLMSSIPRWCAEKHCFTLKLETNWRLFGEGNAEHMGELPTNFLLHKPLCECDFSPAAENMCDADYDDEDTMCYGTDEEI